MKLMIKIMYKLLLCYKLIIMLLNFIFICKSLLTYFFLNQVAINLTSLSFYLRIFIIRWTLLEKKITARKSVFFFTSLTTLLSSLFTYSCDSQEWPTSIFTFSPLLPFGDHIHDRGIFIHKLTRLYLVCLVICLLQRLSDCILWG